MESKILFLGTGSGSVAQQQARATGGIIVLSEGFQFLLDPGPGSIVRAKQTNVNLRYTTAILVSHAHLMHCNDINAIISAMTHNGLDPKGVVIASKSVIDGVEGIAPMLTSFHRGCVERVIIPEGNQKIGIETIEIHALKTHHSDPSALGFKIFTPDFVLAYTGDTGFKKELLEQYKHTDILIVNMPHLDKRDEFSMNKEDVTKLIQKVDPRLAVITHFGAKVHNDDPLEICREIHRVTGVQTIAAKDGLIITPQSYSAGLRHKTLNLFPKSQDPPDIQLKGKPLPDSTSSSYL